MYSNIPVAASIDIMLSHLEKTHVSTDVRQEFSTLLCACLKDNVCVFRNSVYKFSDGLPMGGPLSSLVADLFMDAQEQLFLNFDPLSSQVRYWARYMDDVLCVWHGSLPDLHTCLNHLNAIHPSLLFTMEVGGSKLNYLDLTISLEEHNNVLTPSFSIYRKPTYSGVSIHSSSLHPRIHKSASVTAAIHRMLSIPLNSASRHEEIATIKQIAAVNHLPLNVDQIIRRISARSLLWENSLLPSDLPRRPRWLRLPYLGKASDKLAAFLKRYDYRVGFYTPCTLGQLVRLKDRTPSMIDQAFLSLHVANAPPSISGRQAVS